MKRRRGFLTPLIIGGAFTLFMYALAQTDFMNRLELRMLDYRFVLRDQVPIKPVAMSPDIVVVLVDQATLDRIPEPTVLWLPYWSKAFKAILDSGATTVGLDFILSYADEKQLPDFGVSMLSAPDGAKPYNERLVLIGFLDEDEQRDTRRIMRPHDALTALIGVNNVALANLSRDADGIPRAQLIFPIKVEDAANPNWSTLAALVAEKHTGRKLDAQSRTFGGVALPLLDDGRMLINYTGAHPQFRRVSFNDVLTHIKQNDTAWLKSTFEGKAVLIGPGTFAFQDLSETPFSAAVGKSRTFLGIEVQANILNTLLTGDWLSRAPGWANVVVLLAACMVTAFLSWRLSSIMGIVTSLVTMLTLFLVGFWLFAARNLWLNIAAPIAAVPLVSGLTYARRYAVEEKEKRAIRGIFGKYVSNSVMEELLADPEKLKLGGERREVTVFFSDINGFTSTSEERSPEQVVSMLNAYLDEMLQIVFKHNGTLEKFVGDEIMVMWGAPQPHPEPEKAAIRTALDMVRRLEHLRSLDKSGTAGFYDIKVGIHTGRPIIGNIGAADRVQYTAIGDMVNLASRIMNMTKTLGGIILISERTYERVKDMPDVEFVDLGVQEIRGRQNTVKIYEARDKIKTGEADSVVSHS